MKQIVGWQACGLCQGQVGAAGPAGQAIYALAETRLVAKIKVNASGK
jgi:hypothetical protein